MLTHLQIVFFIPEVELLLPIKYYHWMAMECWWSSSPQERLLFISFYNAFISHNGNLQPPLRSPECHYSWSFSCGYNNFFSYAINTMVLIERLIIHSQKLCFESLAEASQGTWPLIFPQLNQMSVTQTCRPNGSLEFSTWQWPDLGNGEIGQLSTSSPAKI